MRLKNYILIAASTLFCNVGLAGAKPVPKPAAEILNNVKEVKGQVSREIRTEVRSGELSPNAQRIDVVGRANRDAVLEELTEGCTGDCGALDTLVNVARHQGSRRGLVPEGLAVTNVNKVVHDVYAKLTAGKVANTGKAANEALIKMGLVPKDVEDNCGPKAGYAH